MEAVFSRSLLGRRVTCDSKLGSLTTQGHLRQVGVTYDSKIGSLVPTGFFKGNTFRVKGGTGTWGLGVGLGDNLYEIWGQLFWFWGRAQGDLRRQPLWDWGKNPFGFGGWVVGDNLYGTGGTHFWFRGLGTRGIKVLGWDLVGNNLYGTHGGTHFWFRGLVTKGLGFWPFGFGGWDTGTWGLGVGLAWGNFRFWGIWHVARVQVQGTSSAPNPTPSVA